MIDWLLAYILLDNYLNVLNSLNVAKKLDIFIKEMNIFQQNNNIIQPKIVHNVYYNIIDPILNAYKEGLDELLQKQIQQHHDIIKFSSNADDARKKLFIKCDFTDEELSSMIDLNSWTLEYEASHYFSDWDIGFDLNISTSIGILGSLRNKKIYKPIDDGTIDRCSKCKTYFTMFIRKHHCRACGRIFCHLCSQWTEYIPKDLINYIDTKNWIVHDQPSRICQSCRDIIITFRKIECLVLYFEIVAYPIDLCIRASTLCRDWRDAIRIYLSNVRDIQYSIPSSPLLDRDKRSLISNIKNIQGHNKWILQALKMGIFSIIQSDDLKELLEGKRIKSCNNMMCDAGCTEKLTAFDALIILNTSIYNNEVKSFAIKILQETYYPPAISAFLPIENSLIHDFILSRKELFLEFFWLSRINPGFTADIFRNKLLLINQDKAALVQESLNLIAVLESFSPTNPVDELVKQLQNLKTPFMGPFGMIDKFDNDITIKNSATRPVIIRYYSDGIKRAFLYKREDIRKDFHIVSLIRLMYILCNDIFSVANFSNESFLSSSDPINIAPNDINKWVVCGINGCRSLPNNLTYPSKLSRNDETFSIRSNYVETSLPVLESPYILMSNNLIDLSKDVTHLSSEGTKNIDNNFLASYRVMPVSINSGFIEIVPNAMTLLDILARGSISNYLYRSNGNKKISEINSNYSASLAFWTVITFILGVGDRHLENIMIRNDGILFHIDYGFIFGSDSTINSSVTAISNRTISPQTNFVRLDYNLIEGLGGIEMYEPFKLRCCEIYCCLRRNFNLIYACLLRLSSIEPPIKGHDFTQKSIEKFITERFLLGQTEEEAQDAFSKMIDSSREAIVNRVSDAIHNTVSSLKMGWWSY